MKEIETTNDERHTTGSGGALWNAILKYCIQQRIVSLSPLCWLFPFSSSLYEHRTVLIHCQLVFFIIPPPTVRLVSIVGCYSYYTMYCSFTYVPLCSCWRCPVLSLYRWLLRWWWDGVLIVLFYVCLTFICILSWHVLSVRRCLVFFFSISGSHVSFSRYFDCKESPDYEASNPV